ncbi:AimR family lysis-lysogeny pheromone receptor [Pontibacillus marinus]|uniref:Uncharacterized protein n=1 Tax=Pontibacillus marinus BH030004 = DSM 16465 TaxID=1385511 RepID=A0A0A5FVE0_9BACI|nr:AimR family lysis-lysogeny pheromone receptor [Pontibacillus marinus]KGX84771.1 hypothetical protein N783_16165 [Pontibacillus marinus BH030004 = DSM 16465]
MSNTERCCNVDVIFEPFRNNGNESSLYMVYKTLTSQYELNQALHLVKEFCLSSTSEENQRKSLEFLYSSSFFEDINKMIEHNRISEVLENRQWADIFEIMINRKREHVDPYTILKKMERMKPESQEVEVYKTLLTIYSYYDLRETGKGASYFTRLIDQVNAIEDPLMEMYFQERLDDFWFYYHFYRNELILSRRYGFRLVKNSNNSFKVCGIHVVLALTYMLEDYDQAMYHCHEAIAISDRNGYRFSHSIRELNIPFISAVNGIYEGIQTSDPVENAHLSIAKGNIDEAVEVLSKIENPSKLQQYYLGKALGDVEILNKVYNEFIKEGHFFFAKLPLMELRKLKENQNH